MISFTGTGFLRGCVVWCSLPLGAAGAFRSDRGSARGIRCLCVVGITGFESLRGISGDFVAWRKAMTAIHVVMHHRFRRYVWRGFGRCSCTLLLHLHIVSLYQF
jgi:hypothetical protein